MKSRLYIFYITFSVSLFISLVSSEVLPVPGDCTKYQICDVSGCFVFNCGPGTEFNPRVLVCDYPLQDRESCGSFGPYPANLPNLYPGIQQGSVGNNGGNRGPVNSYPGNVGPSNTYGGNQGPSNSYGGNQGPSSSYGGGQGPTNSYGGSYNPGQGSGGYGGCSNGCGGGGGGGGNRGYSGSGGSYSGGSYSGGSYSGVQGGPSGGYSGNSVNSCR